MCTIILENKMWLHRLSNEMILAPIGLIIDIVKLTICIFAEVFISVDYCLRTSDRGVKACFFVLWQTGQGRVGVGMSATVCNQSIIEMLSQNRG